MWCREGGSRDAGRRGHSVSPGPAVSQWRKPRPASVIIISLQICQYQHQHGQQTIGGCKKYSKQWLLVIDIFQDVYQQVCTNYAPQFMELKERNETDSRELLRSGEKSSEIIVVLIMFHNRFLASFSETSFSSWFDDPATTGSG